MGLFSSKKKEKINDVSALGELSKELDESGLKAPTPFQEGNMEENNMKDEIRRKNAEQNLDFPRYSPVTLESVGNEEEALEEDVGGDSGSGFQEMPAVQEERRFSPGSGVQPRGQSLFVKIDKYNGLLDLVTEIRKKLNNADRILKELEDIKKEEEKELRNWQGDIASIKNKLVGIDEQLFKG
jgi:hypothetical protein